MLNYLILATNLIKTSATSFSADPSRFRFLSALMSECRQMKMNKCFWHFVVFGDLTGRPSGKKFAMSKDQKILWERNHIVKRIKDHVLCLRFLYTVKRITLWKSTLVKTLHCEHYHTAKILHCYEYCNVNILHCQDITLWKLFQCKNLTPLSYHSVKILHCCNRDDTVRTEIMLWKDMPQTRQHVLKARWQIQ